MPESPRPELGSSCHTLHYCILFVHYLLLVAFKLQVWFPRASVPLSPRPQFTLRLPCRRRTHLGLQKETTRSPPTISRVVQARATDEAGLALPPNARRQRLRLANGLQEVAEWLTMRRGEGYRGSEAKRGLGPGGDARKEATSLACVLLRVRLRPSTTLHCRCYYVYMPSIARLQRGSMELKDVEESPCAAGADEA